MQEISVSIRPAETSDAIGLARVQIETWRDAYVGVMPDATLVDLDEIRAAVRWTRLVSGLEEPERLSVAVADGDAIGFCHGGPGRRSMRLATEAGERMGEVYALYVDPNFQSLGIGRALLGDVAQGLESDGFEGLTILTLEGNRHARRFYETLGGAPGGTVPSVVSGVPVDQTPYAWPDISVLVRRIETADG
ncbi:MAG: GNAT family N-acetyltransferase [Thalassobaculaceae bacterium]